MSRKETDGNRFQRSAAALTTPICGASNAGTFSSGNARDFNLEGLGVLAATVSASYVAKQSLNGTVSYSAGGTTSFSSTYDTNYEAVPSLAALAGTFAGQVASSAGNENATVTISSAGAISGSGASGCAVSGSASPRTRGNAFNTQSASAGEIHGDLSDRRTLATVGWK